MTDQIYAHLSAKIPEKLDQYLINAYGLMFDEVTASNLVTVSSDDEVVHDPTGMGVNPSGFIVHGGLHNSGTGADPDPTQRFSSIAIPVQGGSGANYYQHKNPDVDRLLQVGQMSFKREDRKAAYFRIQSLIRDDLAFLPICSPAPTEGTKAMLSGFQANPNYQSSYWNVGNCCWET